MNVEDLQPTGLVGQTDLHVHLQPPRPQQSVIDHVLNVKAAVTDDDDDGVTHIDHVLPDGQKCIILAVPAMNQTILIACREQQQKPL